MKGVRKFEDNINIARVGPGEWEGIIEPDWMVGKVVSGGYATALVLLCATGELEAASKEKPAKGQKFQPNAHPDVLSATVHFMSSLFPGKFQAKVEILKSGKTTSTLEMKIIQDEKERLRILAACGDIKLAAQKGPNLSRLSKDSRPPSLPEMSSCTEINPGDVNPDSIRNRIIYLFAPEDAERYEKCRSTNSDGSFDEALLHKRQDAVKGGKADYSAYCMFKDGMEPSLSASPVYLDGSVPSVLGVYVTGWVPTITWTVQFKAHPKPGPMKIRLKTSSITGGFLEEDGELWDSKGNLIAISRQLAMVGVTQKPKASKM